MKKFCVVYNVTTSYDISVKSKTKDEAIAKVKGFVGDDIVVEDAWEIKDATH
jgi:hypothetical protein